MLPPTGTSLAKIITRARRCGGPFGGFLMLAIDNNSHEGRREQERGPDGRFLGSWARLDCEEMPVIAAWIVRANLDDPHRIPYLLVWRGDRELRGSSCARLQDGDLKEAVRLTCHMSAGGTWVAELKRTEGSLTVLRIVWRTLPRNGGRALFLLCPQCNIPRRFVYGWQWDSFSGRSNRVRQVPWCCRSCNLLRYSSEGGYLCQGKRANSMFRAFGLGNVGNLPRPVRWYPHVFTNPDDAIRWLKQTAEWDRACVQLELAGAGTSAGQLIQGQNPLAADQLKQAGTPGGPVRNPSA